MTSKDQPILVTGATGQQGGATAARLLADGWPVRALTRTLDSPAAQALARAGATVVAGDMNDRRSLEAAMRGVFGVFSVQPTPGLPGLPADFDWQTEIRWGTNVVDAAGASGVGHVVYASGFGAEQRVGLRNSDNKWAIEEHLRGSGLSATILRSSSFMENYTTTVPGQGVHDGTLATAIAPDVRQALIALDDIGAVAALAFADPDRFRGQALELAGDALTPPEIAAAVTRATGRPTRYVQVPMDVIRARGANFARSYEYLNSGAAGVPDIAALRTLHPSLLDFATWLKVTGTAKIEAARAAHP
ncbi:NmrA/HSCARG family protein [Actinopolymorpha pittospori]